MDLEEILRSINLILALTVFVWLLLRRIRHPEWYERGSLRRDIWVMALCWDLALIVGSAEILSGADSYLRVGVAMAAILTTLAILIRPPDDWLGGKNESSR